MRLVEEIGIVEGDGHDPAKRSTERLEIEEGLFPKIKPSEHILKKIKNIC